VQASDPNAVVEAIKNLVACQTKLIPLAITEAQRTPDTERQANMAKAIQDLGNLLPQQVSCYMELKISNYFFFFLFFLFFLFSFFVFFYFFCLFFILI
jgi:hypothetical protein